MTVNFLKVAHIKTLFQYILFLIIVLGLIIAATAYSTVKMPIYEFTTDCEIAFDGKGKPIAKTNDPKQVSLSQNIRSFVDFASSHQGEVVYLKFHIEATDHAGGCAMHSAQLPQYFNAGQNSIDFLDIKFGIDNGQVKGQDLWVRTAEFNAGSTHIFLPDVKDINTNGLYTYQQDYAYYAVSGPFVLQYSQANGFNAASFAPVEQSEIFWHEIQCVKMRQKYPEIIRDYIPCF